MVKSEEVRDRQKLANLITQWNQDHYDLFELSAPNEALEFHGVVRFYFQDDDHNVVTKCIRVASSATTMEVVDVLVEKFRPDMRMLTANRYNLFEVHINGEERRLLDSERVLYVQLNWGKDVREGRFLLRREGATTADKENETNFKRKLSKREKKEKKRSEKEKRMNKENVDGNGGVAQQLYTDAPETSFTRSISNPEAVMKRRRQQKLEKKLKQFCGQNGQGGTLKIYGETLKPDVPYKTLLLSTDDTVKHVIKEAMEKYGVESEDTTQFVLVEVLVPPGEREYPGGTIGEERIMDDNECPLSIAMQHPPSRGMLMFQLKRKNADMKPKYKKQRAVSHEDLTTTRDPGTLSVQPSKLPFLMELNPDGTENLKGKVHRLHLNVTEVGLEKSMSTSGQYLQLSGPNIQPRHCVIAHTGGIVTVTPTSLESETYVNNQRVQETTLLQHGMIVRFGKNNLFSFFDPTWEKKQRKGHMPSEMAQKQMNGLQFATRPQETNFDMDGRVEAVADTSRPPHPQRQDSRQSAHSSVHTGSHEDAHRGSPRDVQDGPKFEDALPACLEFRDERENEFLSSIILDSNASVPQFKLSPTYTLYLAVRYRLSSMYKPELSAADRAHKLTSLVNKIAQMINQAIQDNRDNPASLAFWMANASEILHFFKQDHDIHPFSQESQEMLAEAVQMAFHHLVRCLQYDLQRTLRAFLDENEENDEIDDRNRFNRNQPTMMDILDTLSSAMNLLRRCRVNAALTIQLFSQLFHFINMWVFNILVTEKRLQLCTRTWGIRLKRRLGRVESWAEKQGLELAADCHLCRIIQAAHLLEAPKSSPDDIANISSTCFKLNSLQLRELLEHYIPEPNEPPIPHNLIKNVVAVAADMADELIRSDGRVVQLEEDQDLQLPFLLPEDGYSCDTIKGVPIGLADFIEPLSRSGFCRMTLQPLASGFWTVYMSDDEPSHMLEESMRERMERTPEIHPLQQSVPPASKEPEIITVTFNKVKGSMGLSIVAAKGDGQRERGIYIKSVVPEGAAALDGRLQAGDQLLEVDGKSLVGHTQENAAALMTKTGHSVTLKVAKQGAIYHGLATLLSQPSPIMQRASPQKTPATPNKQRPQDEGPPPYNGTQEPIRSGMPKQDSRSIPRDMRGQVLRGPDSRSSPALNSDHKPMSAVERLRVPSAGNLREPGGHFAQQGQQPPVQQGHFNRKDNRDMDKSKSIPNLHIDNSFDGRQDQGMMRPAQSVSALQQQRSPNPNVDYYNQPHSLDDSRSHDYENQPVDARMKNLIDQGRGYPNASQPSPGVLVNRPLIQQQQQVVAPKSLQNFERPQSQYYGQDRTDFPNGQRRPDEIGPEKPRNWQDIPTDNMSPHDSFENKVPNYSNIRPQPNYANQGEIRKIDMGNQSKQPNFYENTLPRQQEPTPPFQQLKRPPSENEKGRPAVVPKPSLAPKPVQPLVQPAEIPRSDVDNRQTQPHFYNPQLRDRKGNLSPNSYNASPGSQSHYQNTSFHDGRADNRSKMLPGQNEYMNKNIDMLPVSRDVPPDLPPPPSIDDLHDDDLPPLPPPPVNDYKLEQKIREEQSRAFQNTDPSYGNLPPQNSRNQFFNGPYEKSSFPVNQSLQPQTSGTKLLYATGYQPPHSAGILRQQPQSMPATIAGYQPSHDYQNINYPSRNLEQIPQNQATQFQHQPSSLYEPYDPRKQPVSPNKPPIHTQIKDQHDAIVSPWQREEREKQQKQQEEDLNKIREMEIADLESRSQRTPQEEERLRKLKLEQEFQRRLQEVESKDEDDSDEEDRFIGSRNSLQEDLVKSRMRLSELEQKRQYEEMEKEKDRLQRLERRIEMFEREREEQRLRQQRRLEKQQREQEEYLKKQKEAREQHKWEIEENLRLQRLEDEKMRERKRIEEEKRKEMERQRLKEIQAQKEAEEARAREQIRRQEQEYQRQQLAEQERRRIEEEREIRVAEERKRLEALANQQQMQNSYYQQYENLPAQGSPKVMPDTRYGQTQYMSVPPDRGLSYNTNRAGNPQDQVDKYSGGYRANNNFMSTPYRPPQENTPSKKSVSFNTQSSQDDNQKNVSNSSYQPFQRAYMSPEQTFTGSNGSNYNQSQSMPVSSVSSPTVSNNDVTYRTQESTPVVIGSQEVYRDPRSKIEAKIANKNKQAVDRLSFRDKMKFFAQEAGENTPIEKPRSSTSQRRIESQLLHNGND